jgi:hypothetical protein
VKKTCCLLCLCDSQENIYETHKERKIETNKEKQTKKNNKEKQTNKTNTNKKVMRQDTTKQNKHKIKESDKRKKPQNKHKIKESSQHTFLLESEVLRQVPALMITTNQEERLGTVDLARVQV